MDEQQTAAGVVNIAGVLRVKNESRWIKQVLRSIVGLCERIYILDDGSTDDTRWICSHCDQVRLFESPFSGLNETRDKNWLLGKVIEDGWAEYVLAIDGDEELEPSGPYKIRTLIANADIKAASIQVVYLWDKPDQWRTDGVYKDFRRPSLFRLMTGHTEYVSTNAHGNLHCSNVPYDLVPHAVRTDIRLLHWGYFDREMRISKHAYYNRVDPNNSREDCYRHIVQGDIPEVPADAWLLHAGPLRLEPLA